MTSFSRFQERNKKRTVAQNKLNTNFIFNSYPSIEITGSDGQKIQASVVNKQEKDYAYILTQLQDELMVGDIWTAKNLHLLVTEEITIIKDVNWRKYHALLCNVQIGNYWGYFKGSEKSFLDTILEKDVLWESPQKPILVLPNNILNFRDKVVIGGRAWIVQEYDSISTPGLVYYSLKPSTISKQTLEDNVGNKTYIEKYVEPAVSIIDKPTNEDSVKLISANMNITISTEDGYFTSSKNVKILKRVGNEVVFSIPFGVQETTIERKQKGDIIKEIYRVV